MIKGVTTCVRYWSKQRAYTGINAEVHYYFVTRHMHNCSLRLLEFIVIVMLLLGALFSSWNSTWTVFKIYFLPKSSVTFSNVTELLFPRSSCWEMEFPRFCNTSTACIPGSWELYETLFIYQIQTMVTPKAVNILNSTYSTNGSDFSCRQTKMLMTSWSSRLLF